MIGATRFTPRSGQGRVRTAAPLSRTMGHAPASLARPDARIVFNLEPDQDGASPPCRRDRRYASGPPPGVDPVPDHRGSDPEIGGERRLLIGIGSDHLDQPDPDIAHLPKKFPGRLGAPVGRRRRDVSHACDDRSSDRPGCPGGSRYTGTCACKTRAATTDQTGPLTTLRWRKRAPMTWVPASGVTGARTGTRPCSPANHSSGGSLKLRRRAAVGLFEGGARVGPATREQRKDRRDFVMGAWRNGAFRMAPRRRHALSKSLAI